MPNLNYIQDQKDLTWTMRAIFTDWLVQVHSRFRMPPETLFLAINIIDGFLSNRMASLAKLQPVGVTCLFIAAKVELLTPHAKTSCLLQTRPTPRGTSCKPSGTSSRRWTGT